MTTPRWTSRATGQAGRVMKTDQYAAAMYAEPTSWCGRDDLTEPQRNRRRFAKSSLRRRMHREIAAGLHECALCGLAGAGLTIDHIVPLHHGGSNDPTNLQILCISCNSSKGARI